MNKEKQKKKSVLFVDDEPKILQGLNRMLRKMRTHWDMKFAPGGSEALEILNQQHIDVVVSDMRMPNMDGSQLLKQVQKRFPKIVRIILSGHADQEFVFKSVGSAHQYLSKPCDSKLLISTIKRSCALRDLIEQESIMRIVSQTESLQSLPSFYVKMIQELQSPGGSVQKLGKIINRDIGISAKILQLVNSSFFGLPHHVSDPSDAVIFLGIDTIRALVLTLGIFSQFDVSKLSKLHIEEIYNHSIKTGAIARAIANKENLEPNEVDNAFMAGLLHDLGKLVFATNFPVTYQNIFTLLLDGKTSFHKAEIKKFGTSHAEVGAYLLGLWGLSDTIVEAVAFHHNPELCLSSEFCPHTAVYVANIFEKNIAENDIRYFHDKFNRKYIKQLNLTKKLPAWKKIAEEIMLEDNNQNE